METKTLTREDWLHQAINVYISKLFKYKGFPLPDKVRVSVGLPHGRGSKRAIGQHWAPESSSDKVSSIFISPVIADSTEVLSTLVHELVHAAVGNKAGHGPKFKHAALAVGLDGPMLSTVPTAELKRDLEILVKKIGPYPHSKLLLGRRPDKKQTTRMIKMSCPSCGYICRATHTHILSVGPVICSCNSKQMTVHLPDEDQD